MNSKIIFWFLKKTHGHSNPPVGTKIRKFEPWLYLWFCMLMLQYHKEAEAAGHFVRFHNQNQSETQKGNRNMRFTQY